MTKIQVRRDTASNWTSNNPTPASGEMCYETDTGKLKIGNGTTPYNSLPYIGDGGSTGTTDYTQLTNKPQINNVELQGNKTLVELGIQPAGNYLTEVPAEYVTETELEGKGYITSSALANYATVDTVEGLENEVAGINNELSNKMDTLSGNAPLSLDIKNPNGIEILNMDNDGVSKCWSTILAIGNNVEKSYGGSTGYGGFGYYSTEPVAWEDIEQICVKVPYTLGQTVISPIYNTSENSISVFCIFGWEDENNVFIPAMVFYKRSIEIITNPTKDLSYTPAPTTGYTRVGKFSFGKITNPGSYSGGGDTWNNCLSDMPNHSMALRLLPDKSGLELVNVRTSGSTISRGFCDFDNLSDKSVLDQITQVRFYPRSVQGNSSSYSTDIGVLKDYPLDVSTCAVYDTPNSLSTYNTISSLGTPVLKATLKNTISLNYDTTTLGVNDSNQLYVKDNSGNLLEMMANAGIVTNFVLSWGTQKPTTNGTSVTVYAGTTLVCPVGFSEDGKPKNEIYTLTEDKVITPTSNLILLAVRSGNNFNCSKFYIRANQSVPADKPADSWIYSKKDNKNYQYAATPTDPTFNQYDYIPAIGLIKSGATITDLVLNDNPFLGVQLYNTGG